MLNLSILKIDALSDVLERNYREVFGPDEPIYATKLGLAAKLVLEMIANSDALYHDVDHTIMVTLVGQEILRGRHIKTQLAPVDWFHYTVATLCHDIGYVRGVCAADTRDSFVIDEAGNRVTPPRGASDAFFTPYHISRGKIAVRERLGPLSYYDEERIARAIELTRFPVPDKVDHRETNTEAGLVRAADLIGQLADPNHLLKLNRLYYEFVETGEAIKLGYKSPADLVDSYPSFYWNIVSPYIGDAIKYLELTQEGKQWIANLYSNVFVAGKMQYRLGPDR
ncbi:metal-dependent phosphohydrolase [Nitrosomonas sp. PY1]|uniref:hypothetical protein n=1 Tax=Nitrosomonas sp. PY1 TaxID=1803906 RepID=UPI001FC88B17|nr:hypothetical protein [Nitrosomonas sp. PY1]GKS69814.1 metal-dependent phosphohydrolase [Nitrosomonas sp. PY1]